MANELNKFDMGAKVRFFNPETNGMDPVTFEVTGTHEGKSEWFYSISGFDPDTKETIDFKHVREDYIFETDDQKRFIEAWLHAYARDAEEGELDELESEEFTEVMGDATLSGLATNLTDLASNLDDLEEALNSLLYTFNARVLIDNGIYYFTYIY